MSSLCGDPNKNSRRNPNCSETLSISAQVKHASNSLSVRRVRSWIGSSLKSERSEMKTNHGQHAIVMGGSMAGLLTARVLSQHFERVTLIERDVFPEAASLSNRKGVPQGRHAHALLARGRQIVERYFPGIIDDLHEQGAITEGADVTGTGLWHQYGHAKLQVYSHLPGLLMSRPLIESVVRARVMALPNLTVRQNCDADHLLTNADRSRITGVRVIDRQNEQVEDLQADLIIDASGRGSKSPKWLQMLGYAAPAESIIKVDLAYATRLYPRNPNDLTHIVVSEAPPNGTRGCAMLALEGDRFIVTLVGYTGDHPAADDQAFLEFARSLPTPAVYDRIKNVAPLSDIATHKFPANLRRHYEKLTRMPERYLVLGDAMCSFNPVYGQGMSVAAMEAEALDQVLSKAQSLDGLRKPFYKKAMPAVDVPWTLASGADLAYTKVEGTRNPVVNAVNAYVAKVHLACCVDAVVAKTFFEVANLVASPNVLFAPKMVLRVLKAARQLDAKASTSTAQPQPQTA